MKTALLVFFCVGCGSVGLDPPTVDMEGRNDLRAPAQVGDLGMRDDLADALDLSSQNRADFSAQDMARASDLATLSVSDMAQPRGDMAQACGQAAEACCFNGGPPNPNICIPSNVNCRALDNLCVYCGSGGQICCSGDRCNASLACTLRPGDTQKTCN